MTQSIHFYVCLCWYCRGKSDRQIQTEVFVFINKSPNHWYIEISKTDGASIFGEELCAMNTSVDMVEAINYKIRMFGVPINGFDSVFWCNKAIYNNTFTPESVLTQKHHLISYHKCRKSVANKTIMVSKQRDDNNLAYMFTNFMTALRRRFFF